MGNSADRLGVCGWSGLIVLLKILPTANSQFIRRSSLNDILWIQKLQLSRLPGPMRVIGL